MVASCDLSAVGVRNAEESFVASHEWPSEREVSNAQPSPALAISANGVLSERGPGHSLRCSCFSLSTVGLSEGDRDVVALDDLICKAEMETQI